MSGKIKRLVKLGGKASLDMFAGCAINYVVDSFYSADPTTLNYLQLVTRVVSRVYFTAFLGDEVLDFLYPLDIQDPTNGFFFAAAMLWQPQMFSDTRLLVAKTIEKVVSLPVFNYFPTLANVQKNPNDPDIQKPAEAKIQEATNNSLNLLQGWSS